MRRPMHATSAQPLSGSPGPHFDSARRARVCGSLPRIFEGLRLPSEGLRITREDLSSPSASLRYESRCLRTGSAKLLRVFSMLRPARASVHTSSGSLATRSEAVVPPGCSPRPSRVHLRDACCGIRGTSSYRSTASGALLDTRRILHPLRRSIVPARVRHASGSGPLPSQSEGFPGRSEGFPGRSEGVGDPSGSPGEPSRSPREPSRSRRKPSEALRGPSGRLCGGRTVNLAVITPNQAGCCPVAPNLVPCVHVPSGV